jgi:hypothetical protein
MLSATVKYLIRAEYRDQQSAKKNKKVADAYHNSMTPSLDSAGASAPASAAAARRPATANRRIDDMLSPSQDAAYANTANQSGKGKGGKIGGTALGPGQSHGKGKGKGKGKGTGSKGDHRSMSHSQAPSRSQSRSQTPAGYRTPRSGQGQKRSHDQATEPHHEPPRHEPIHDGNWRHDAAERPRDAYQHDNGWNNRSWDDSW